MTRTMRCCAFLTAEDPSTYVIDDALAYEPLRALGWRVESVPWSQRDAAWGAYDAVVIRSTYDYANAPDVFLGVLDDIERAGTPLFNALDLVRWNIRKTYLRDLAERGVSVVPTVSRERLNPGELSNLPDEVDAPVAVIKPLVGASADGAYRFDRQAAREVAVEIEAYYADRAFMAQPFVHAITAEGEFSLFYFNGVYSHAILKTPKSEDFRVQEEHGGLIRPVWPDAALRAVGDDVVLSINEPPLYARADFVRANGGVGFWLMELELIEPSLYLRMDDAAASRFAHAFHERAIQRLTES